MWRGVPRVPYAPELDGSYAKPLRKGIHAEPTSRTGALVPKPTTHLSMAFRAGFDGYDVLAAAVSDLLELVTHHASVLPLLKLR
jgi:hypothetical protein